MFTEDLMRHIINYIEDYPEDIRLDDHRDEHRVIISGRMGNNHIYGSSRNDFCLSFVYDKSGNLKDVNGIDFNFDTTPLKEAFSKAICRNFKLSKKLKKLKKEI